RIYKVQVAQQPVSRNESLEVSRESGKEVGSKKKLGRNDPCWCGSGKKYKKCHLNDDLAHIG
ncbi:SEC-C domain-containing protein, partial [Candidatus Microgenomates bacterium]|nr:SEC-C domain-containing protein [Candidatus Microgenomates bacterium]